MTALGITHDVEAFANAMVVVADRDSAELLRSLGLRAAGLDEPHRLDADLPRGPGSEVVLVGERPEAIAGDLLHRAGTESAWFCPLPVGTKSVHALLERPGIAAEFDGETLRHVWRAWIEGQSKQLRRQNYQPTNHPDLPGRRPRKRLCALSPAELAALPAREFLVHGLVPVGSTALVFGPWGSGKSFLTTALAVAIADGSPFLGRRTRQGAVLLLLGEGSGGYCDRLRAAVGVARVSDPLDPIQQRLRVCGLIPDLTDTEWLAALREALRSLPSPRVVVVDTLARALAAASLDENDSTQSGQLIAALDGLTHEFPDLARVVVHHSGHGNEHRARGSSALAAAADVVMRSERTLDGCILHCEKLKDGATPDPVRVHFGQAVVGQDEHGDPRTSLYVSGFGPLDNQDLQGKRPRAKDAIMAVLDAAGDDGIGFGEARTATSRAGSTVSETLAQLVTAGDVLLFKDSKGRQRWRRRTKP